MFNWLKKELAAEEYGHQMWLYCCDTSEKFCGDFGPMLEYSGFLKGANCSQVFADETIKLHLWIVSRVLGVQDRDVLDALHNHINTSPNLFTNLRDRYALYDRENAKDIELIRQGLPQVGLAEAFLEVVGNKRPDSTVLVETVAIQCTIGEVFKTVSEKRKRVTIRRR
jgi:hypothetical protein